MRSTVGFTVVELVLVTAILGILALAAIPALTNMGSVRVHSAARRLVSDLAYARQLARTRNGTYGISFDAAANQYTLFLWDPVTATATAVADPLTLQPLALDLDQAPGLAGVDLQNPNFGGGSEIRFLPAGIPQDANGNNLAAAGTVWLEDGGTLRSVIVQPETGEVSSP